MRRERREEIKKIIEERKKEEKKRIEETFKNLSKNEFTIPKKYKYKRNLAKFIRRIYREYKWLRINHFKFLITENFKNFEEIKKIKLNRNGLVLCYNGTKIVCVYFVFLVDIYLEDIIENMAYSYEPIPIDLKQVLNVKRILDNRFKNKRIIEKRI